jgi:cytochrome c
MFEVALNTHTGMISSRQFVLPRVPVGRRPGPTMRLVASAFVVVLLSAAAAFSQAAQPAPASTGKAFAALPPGHPDDGQAVFKKCMACHSVGPTAKNSVGPALNGIIGRKAGTYAGYSYSDANKNSGITWSDETLAEYLPSPMDLVPGTKMTFTGLTMPQDVADVIAYLKQFDAQGNKKPGS